MTGIYSLRWEALVRSCGSWLSIAGISAASRPIAPFPELPQDRHAHLRLGSAGDECPAQGQSARRPGLDLIAGTRGPKVGFSVRRDRSGGLQLWTNFVKGLVSFRSQSVWPPTPGRAVAPTRHF
jgi:hypothetical protein